MAKEKIEILSDELEELKKILKTLDLRTLNTNKKLNDHINQPKAEVNMVNDDGGVEAWTGPFTLDFDGAMERLLEIVEKHMDVYFREYKGKTFAMFKFVKGKKIEVKRWTVK